MFRLFFSLTLVGFLILYSIPASAQTSEDTYVVHIQTNKIKSDLGDDAAAFNEMLRRQAGVINSDARVIRSYFLRHFWGADSRDLVLVAEFKNTEDLFSFYGDLNSMLEEAFSKEQLDKDNAMWNKYVGQHADEIYQETSGTRK